MDLRLKYRTKYFPYIHRIKCSGELQISVPTDEYMKENGLTEAEAFMECLKCGKRWHIATVEPEGEEQSI